MKSILIVDDEEKIRLTYGKLLKREGFKVFFASNAVNANDVLVKEKIDLVLLDIKMTEVNGDTFFYKIHAFHKKVKVIIASVYPIEEQKQRVQEAADYYDKSEALTILVDKVKSHLKESSPGTRKKIMIIDDEIKASLTRHVLEKAGYEAVGFSDYDTALEFLRDEKNKVDIVIIDIAMPGINACYFVEMIKMKHPEAKILIASSYPAETQEICVFDADDYFDKSDGSTVLLEKVGMLI